MSRIFRIGIIGCGGIANGKHLPSLSKLKILKSSHSVTSLANAQKRLLINTAQKALLFMKITKNY